MKKEIDLILAAALFLQGCNTVRVSAKSLDRDQKIPEYSYVDPTVTPLSISPISHVIIEATATKEAILPFLYFSNEDYFKGVYTVANKNEPAKEFKEVDCGILVGAMVTRTDPQAYLDAFYAYFKEKGLYGPAMINANGTDMKDHIATLESLEFEVEDLTKGKTTKEIKEEIKEFTSQGIPVWVNAKFKGIGHNSMAVGVSPDGSIIFNDPVYGERVIIPDNEIQMKDLYGRTLWRVYAIIDKQQ